MQTISTQLDELSTELEMLLLMEEFSQRDIELYEHINLQIDELKNYAQFDEIYDNLITSFKNNLEELTANHEALEDLKTQFDDTLSPLECHEENTEPCSFRT